MKALRIFILTSLLFACSNKVSFPGDYIKSDNQKYPFQVLHAESAFRKNTKEHIGPLQDIKNNENLVLNNGYLILIHYSGKFLEFEGDTIIDIEKLNAFLSVELNLKRIKERPDMNFLLSKNPHKKFSFMMNLLLK